MFIARVGVCVGGGGNTPTPLSTRGTPFSAKHTISGQDRRERLPRGDLGAKTLFWPNGQSHIFLANKLTFRGGWLDHA